MEVEIGYEDDPLGTIFVRAGRVDMMSARAESVDALTMFLNDQLRAMIEDFGFDPQTTTADQIVEFIATRSGGGDYVRVKGSGPKEGGAAEDTPALSFH